MVQNVVPTSGDQPNSSNTSSTTTVVNSTETLHTEQSQPFPILPPAIVVTSALAQSQPVTTQSAADDISLPEQQEPTQHNYSEEQQLNYNANSPLPPIQWVSPVPRTLPMPINASPTLSPVAASAPISSMPLLYTSTTLQPSTPIQWDLFSLPLQGISPSPLLQGLSPVRPTASPNDKPVTESPLTPIESTKVTKSPTPSPTVSASSDPDNPPPIPTSQQHISHRSAPICVGAAQLRRTTSYNVPPSPNTASPPQQHSTSVPAEEASQKSTVTVPQKKIEKLVWKQHSWIQAADIYKNLVIFLSNDLKYFPRKSQIDY